MIAVRVRARGFELCARAHASARPSFGSRTMAAALGALSRVCGFAAALRILDHDRACAPLTGDAAAQDQLPNEAARMRTLMSDNRTQRLVVMLVACTIFGG